MFPTQLRIFLFLDSCFRNCPLCGIILEQDNTILESFVTLDCNLLLQQVRVLDPLSKTDRIADVLIIDGKIQAIESHLESTPENVPILEAQGLILAPGLMDLYSHSGEPGHEDRETLTSLAAAATAGGFTSVAILPDTLPCIDNRALVDSLRQKSALMGPKLHFWGAITLNREGQQMSELGDLIASGVIGFTDSRPIDNLGLLRRVLEYLNPLKKTIALVPVSRSLRGNGVMREGLASITYGLPGNPAMSETTAIASLIELIADLQTPVHLMRVSTRRGVELIAEAKARGIPITASTSWMHLLLNTNALKSYDPNLHLEPPLGNEEDLRALREGVKAGVIDAIAVDHHAYSYEEKTVSFAESPTGAIGLELVLPLLWQQFVVTEEWSALELWQALSLNPRLCVGETPISCQPQQPAELILFDPQGTWIVNENSLKSGCLNTPWLGKQLTGKVLRVWN